MKPEINKWIHKVPPKYQKGYPIKHTQKLWKKADLPPVQVNIRRWRPVPLGPQEEVVNRKAIKNWHRRARLVEEEKQKD